MTPEEPTTEEKSYRSYWGFVLWPLAVIVFYALSAAPASLVYKKGIFPQELVNVYRPLELALFTTHLERPFFMYMHLWRPDMYNRDGTVVRGE